MNKKEVLRFRCTPFEKAIIETKAKKTGQSSSEYCRSSALDKKLRQKLSEEEIELYRMLKQYHNNFSRISNYIKQRDSRLAPEVEKTAIEIRKHLKKFE